MNSFEQLIGNRILVSAVTGWFVAQILKTLIYTLMTKRFEPERLVGSGGMPSSHSSFVCTCATCTAILTGVDSVTFAISVVLALVVMYDAANVRKETGEQAKVLNYIMENWGSQKPELFAEELKELIGHTWLQVGAGLVLGILVGVVGCALWP